GSSSPALTRSMARSIGPRAEAVTGTFRFPLILGTYFDGPTTFPFSSEEIQDHLFDGPNQQGPTVPEYYSEISGGLVELEGVTFDWVTTDVTRSQVTRDGSGLRATQVGGVGGFVESIVLTLDAQGVDWGQFDSTGDGYVDVLTVIHPGRGAECDSDSSQPDRIWSHRWTLADMTAQRLSSSQTGDVRDGIRTSTPHPGGGFVHVNDYTIQPLLSCDSTTTSVRIAEIGTFAHELGHGFGLPDLYRTGGSGLPFYAGVGNWDLMGTGSYGCGGSQPEQPCHMGAWSKEALGWVTSDVVPADTEQTVLLEPVESSRRVLKVLSGDGSGDYVLLENRQRVGTDVGLPEPGLLVWQIDQGVLDARWSGNTVNNDPARMGVWLRQADGRGDLTQAGGGRGDRGDPFPGCIKDNPLDYNRPEIPCASNPEFHAGKAPFALSHLGGGLGATLTGIEAAGGGSASMAFELDTRMFILRVEAEEDGASVGVEGFLADGTPRPATPFELLSAPFQTHAIVAAAGIPTGPDERLGFVAWADGAARSREFSTGFSDATLLARYGIEQIRLGVATNDPADGIAPATFVATPGTVEPEDGDFWFPPGTDVSITALPRTGFSFREWVGVEAPAQNPITLTLDQPTDLTANFDLVYAFADIDEELTFEAAQPQNITFEVSDANAPVHWSVTAGSLPPGISLGQTSGRLTGAANTTGEFPVELLARDAIGLEARASILVTVERPNLGLEQLASTFIASTDQVSFLQKEFLDRHGNLDGSYDVGDFRAYVLRHPDLPESAVASSDADRVIPLGPVRVPESGP
ncbi:MAG: M6 family metalloprotease domain-containing protein, partial [Gemmatimonadota bacterium]